METIDKAFQYYGHNIFGLLMRDKYFQFIMSDISEYIIFSTLRSNVQPIFGTFMFLITASKNQCRIGDIFGHPIKHSRE